MLAVADAVRAVAEQYASRTNAFFLGRAGGFPVALEGAQKLKEVSYIHAEAYPASELKHGPLALISPETPTVMVLPQRRPVREVAVVPRGDPGAPRSGDRA